MTKRHNAKRAPDRISEASAGTANDKVGVGSEPRVKPARWPLLVIGLGAALTVLWIGLLGWGAVELAAAILP
jgi:hypothetical protein